MAEVYRLYKTARRLENESKLDHLDQTQRNSNPEMAVLFTKNQTKGTPVTETIDLLDYVTGIGNSAISPCTPCPDPVSQREYGSCHLRQC